MGCSWVKRGHFSPKLRFLGLLSRAILPQKGIMGIKSGLFFRYGNLS